jgi:hypothetical protein
MGSASGLNDEEGGVEATELALLLSGRAAFLAALGPLAVMMMLSWNHSGHGYHDFLVSLSQVAVLTALPLFQCLWAWPTMRGADGGL